MTAALEHGPRLAFERERLGDHHRPQMLAGREPHHVSRGRGVDRRLQGFNAGRDDVTFSLPESHGPWIEQVNTASLDAPLTAAPSGGGVVLPARTSAIFLRRYASQA